jgi:hypothetical protein
MNNYFDYETDHDIKAHLHEYSDKRRNASELKNNAEWLFFYGASRALQRLLWLSRGRSDAEGIPKSHRRHHDEGHIRSCHVCMGSGYHPQKQGDSVRQKHLDTLSNRLKKAMLKVKNPPSCPVCAGKIEYGVYLGTEKIAASCRKCHSRYGNGFKDLKQALRFFREKHL